MAAEQTAPRTYEERIVAGRVDRENDTGIRVVQADGTAVWADFGQYFKGPRPGVGQDVELLVKGKFIRTAKVLGAGGEPMPWDEDDSFGGGDDSAPAQGTAAPRPIRQAAPAPAPTKAPGRATLKAAALAAAAHFHSGRADSTEDAVYETAHRFLAFLEADD
jgi:hypothetical protein